MLRTAATALTVPPTNIAFFLFCAALLSFWEPGRRMATRAIVLGSGLLVLLSLPVIAMTFLASLETGPVSAPSQPPSAIIILGGDVEKVNDTPNVVLGPLSLERVRAGARLARSTGLPLLVSGGIVNHTAIPVATLMQQSLAADFNRPARWAETTSFDTWENAAYSALILQDEGIRTVFVVTHSWHMRRALLAFRQTGLEVIPVPVRRERHPTFAASEFVPSASAWLKCYFAFHEWIGLAWYALRG